MANHRNSNLPTSADAPRAAFAVTVLSCVACCPESHAVA